MAHYNGDGTLLPSTSPAVTQVVNAPGGTLPSTTTLTSNASPIVAGASVTFSAAVIGSSSICGGFPCPPPVMDGAVAFADAGTPLCTVKLNGGFPGQGYATCTTSALTTAGVHVITASYTGDNSNAPSSATLNQTVNPQPVNGACGGDNGKTLAGTPTNLCSAGTASVVTGTGPWSWTCDGTSGGTNASCSAQLQARAATSTTLTASPSPGTVGKPVSIAVSVKPASGSVTSTGSVTVGDGTLSCSITLAAGTGSCSLTFATPGTRTLTAAYSGDSSFAPSSGTTSEPVDPAPLITTTTTLTLAPNPAGVNQPVTASVTTTGAATTSLAKAALAAAGGNVVVSAGALGCTATLINGAGSCALTFAAAGTYAVSANYSGDAIYAPSSASVNEVVNAAVPATTTPAPALGTWAMTLLILALGAGASVRVQRIGNGKGLSNSTF